MIIIGVISIIVGSILFLMTKVMGRNNRKKFGKVMDEDMTSLVEQTLLLIKIIAAVLVAVGVLLTMLIK